jgi:PAS domain-containing protein
MRPGSATMWQGAQSCPEGEVQMTSTSDAAATTLPPPDPGSRRWRWALTGVPLVQALLVLPLLPAVADGGRAALPTALGLAAVAALALAALLWWSLGRAAVAFAGLRRMQELFDALPLGIAVYDLRDRLEIFNASFRELYTPLGDLLRPGRSFTEMLRGAVERGLVPDARGREEAWIEDRVWNHGRAGYGTVREMADGRFRRIVEHRLSDGSLLAYSVDVTDLVRRAASR